MISPKLLRVLRKNLNFPREGMKSFYLVFACFSLIVAMALYFKIYRVRNGNARSLRTEDSPVSQGDIQDLLLGSPEVQDIGLEKTSPNFYIQKKPMWSPFLDMSEPVQFGSMMT